MTGPLYALLYLLTVAVWFAPLHAEAERIRWRQTLDRWAKELHGLVDHLAWVATTIRHAGLTAAEATERLTVARTDLRDGMAHLEDVVATAVLVAPTYHGPPMPGWPPRATRPPEESDVDAAPGMTLDELLDDIDRLTGDPHDR